MLTTDQNGIIAFTASQEDYMYQVLSVPEGHELDNAFEETVTDRVEVKV